MKGLQEPEGSKSSPPWDQTEGGILKEVCIVITGSGVCVGGGERGSARDCRDEPEFMCTHTPHSASLPFVKAISEVRGRTEGLPYKGQRVSLQGDRGFPYKGQRVSLQVDRGFPYKWTESFPTRGRVKRVFPTTLTSEGRGGQKVSLKTLTRGSPSNTLRGRRKVSLKTLTRGSPSNTLRGRRKVSLKTLTRGSPSNTLRGRRKVSLKALTRGSPSNTLRGRRKVSH